MEFKFVGRSLSQAAPSDSGVLDIVFLHGITGHQFDTWGADKAFWPEWLAYDFPQTNIYCAGFRSTLLTRIGSGGGLSIMDCATMLVDRLVSRSKPAPRVLLITHSLGGLIAKQALRKCNDSSDPKWQRLLEQVCGVVFLGTPHAGAQLASVLSRLFSLATSKQLDELQYGTDQLIDLGHWFSNWADPDKLMIRAFYETQKIKGLLIVDKITADPHTRGCIPIAVDADHIGICKPINRTSQVYESLVSFIGDVSGDTFRAQTSDGTVAPEVMQDFETFTSTAEVDRRSLSEKLTDAGREFEIKRAETKKERFSKALQRHAVLPSAVTRYTKLMADVESRFSRHVARAIAEKKSAADIDKIIETDVVDPVVKSHGDGESAITATLVDDAVYYLGGNCHLRWEDGKD